MLLVIPPATKVAGEQILTERLPVALGFTVKMVVKIESQPKELLPLKVS